MGSSEQDLGRGHPITDALAHLEAELAAVGDTPAWSLGEVDTRHALLALSRVSSRLAGLESRSQPTRTASVRQIRWERPDWW